MIRPKRQYTVSEKALAANRRNLILARAVEPQIRFRVTDRRREACRANLEKAVAALRAASLTPDGYRPGSAGVPPALCDRPIAGGTPALAEKGALPDSPAYGVGFTRGLYAVSLRRSARLAGETSAELDAHVALFAQALAPRNQRERQLARGIAETVWRRLRVFRGQARWERISLDYRLRQAARGPSPQQWLDDGLTPVSLASDLAFEINRIFSCDENLSAAAEKLNARLERLSRLWVAGRGCDPRLFECAAPLSVRDGLLLGRSPAAMGNPFISPGEIDARLQLHALRRLPHFQVSSYGDGPPRARREADFWDDIGGDATRYGMMRRAALHRNGGFTPPAFDLDGSGQFTSPAPGGDANAAAESGGAAGAAGGDADLSSREALEALWAMALEGISAGSHTRVSVAVSGYTAREEKLESRNQKPQEEAMHRDTGNSNTQSPDPNPQSAIDHQQSSITQALWSRLRCYADVAEREAAEVKLLLLTKICGQMHEEFGARLERLPQGATLQPVPDGGTVAFLLELVLLFNRSSNARAGALESPLALSAELYKFLEARFGPHQDFNLLKPGYASAVFKAQAESARQALEERLAQDEQFEAQPGHRQGSPAEQLARAERHCRDVVQLGKLPRTMDVTSMEGFFVEPVGSLTSVSVGKGDDREWDLRHFVAIASGMLPRPPGWKFESRARCRARVGMNKKENRK